ncbi:MAG: nickel ABC transporter, nickel/metallophore periplasmic binding protein [Dethiosulfovibrio peptidovorans]|nr:MAG: nickel ABC transporter, nickel/metallophore periplasmic binding protein [Dethiosulfovibrio peptidovorans]
MTLGLCLSTLLALSATAHAPDTLVYSWSGNAGGDLNPHLYSPNQMYAQNMIFESLVRYSSRGTIEPCLAESWDISDDGLRYTFHLRKGVTFSDGSPWNSKAAKANMDAVMENAKRHAWLGLVGQIDSTEVSDEHTMVLVLKAPYAATLWDLSLIRPFRFLSPSAFGEDGGTAKGIKKPIGTGPWIHAEEKKGEYDLFVRNDGYWGPKPTIAKILVKVIPESESRVVALETGEIDLIFGASGQGAAQISIEAFRRLEAMGRYETGISGPRATRLLAINSGCGVTADLAVRKAILHAVDKDALVKGVFLGMEKRADFLFSPQMPFCNLGLPPYEYDLDKANSLLDKAGWVRDGEYRAKDGKELRLDICFIGTDTVQKAIAEVLQSNLKRIGMKLDLTGVEKDAYYKRQKNGTFGLIFSDTWGAPYEPHAMVSSMRVPSHADYQAQSGLPMKKELDKKIAQVLIAVGDDRCQRLYREILTTLHDQAVYLPLSYRTLVKVHVNELQGVVFPAFITEVPFESMSWK